MGVAAVVTQGATGPTDTITVLWTSRDADGSEENPYEEGVRWASNGGLPTEGDEALLFVDDRADPWALVWATGGAT